MQRAEILALVPNSRGYVHDDGTVDGELGKNVSVRERICMRVRKHVASVVSVDDGQ